MKKIITAMLIAGMILSFASCGNNDVEETTTEATTTEATTTTEETTTGETTTENAGGEVASIDAKSALAKLFDEFHNKLAPAFGVESGEEVKGAYVGTDTEVVDVWVDEETGEEYPIEMPIAAPSAIDLSSEENHLYMTYFPSELTDKLDSAAFFMSMMNANNGGTFAAFELKDAADAQAVADALKEALANNMWMCGMPDGFYIAEANGVIFSGFAGNDPLNAFKEAVSATYENVNVLYNETIGF